MIWENIHINNFTYQKQRYEQQLASSLGLPGSSLLFKYSMIQPIPKEPAEKCQKLYKYWKVCQVAIFLPAVLDLAVSIYKQ